MDASTSTPIDHRTVGPRRIVALVLLALAIAGLAFVRLSSGAETVAVPPGAHAGQLTLHPCTYATEDGGYRADCGTLVVPENRADPHSRLIALRVTRIHARSDASGAPIFRLEGGPGISNMHFADASRLAGHHDVVLVGYRGIDSSSRLDCPEVTHALEHSNDFLADASVRAYGAAFRDCGDRLQADGVDLAGYTLQQRVEDLEDARRALGYGKIDLLSESAGTRTALIYGWRHPQSIHRSVMIGVNPPGHFLWSSKLTDEQLARYSRLCAEDTRCLHQTGDLADTARSTLSNVPSSWGPLPIKQGNVRVATLYGLAESTHDAAPLSGPMTLNSLVAAAHGDTSGLWFVSLMADIAFPRAFVWGDLAAVARIDATAADRYFAKPGDPSNPGYAATRFIWGGGELGHAFPPTPGQDEYDTVRTSNVETLLVGGTLDFATPPQAATRELLPQLRNGHQVVLSDLGHTTSFWSYEPKASTHLLTTFFDTGRVDDSLYTHAKVDFTPGVTHPMLAKAVAATMAGLALVTVLSLLAMWLRARRRGRFGRKASATLRSVFPLVLGLGGWFLGVLIVLVSRLTVPVDDPILAMLSIGVPVGLGIYFAWLDRNLSARDRSIALTATLTGAVVGGWLGYHAASGLLALITTIVGATVGANIVLLGRDIAHERSARTPVAASQPGSVPAGA